MRHCFLPGSPRSLRFGWSVLMVVLLGLSLRADPRIQPIPNQILTYGAPPLRVPVFASDPNGEVQVTASVSGKQSPLRVLIETVGDRRALNLRVPEQFLTVLGRASVTVTAASGGKSNSVTFFVVVQAREFLPWNQIAGGASWQGFAARLSPLFPAAFGWADISGDGYPDVVIAGGNGVQLNPAGSSAARNVPFGQRASLNTGLRGVVWGDVDGDGDPDAFAYGSPLLGIYRTSRISGQSPVLTLMTNALERIATEGAAFVDLDGNGTLDLVYSGVTNEARRVITAMNDGQGNFIAVPNDLPHMAGPVVAADFDGDGRVDLLLGDNSAFRHMAQIFWNRFPDPFEAGPILSDAQPVTAAGTVDANGDGVPDVWLVQAVRGNRRSLEMNLFLQRSGGFARSFGLSTNQFAGAAEPVWGDFNHDGRMDLVAPFEGRVLNGILQEVVTNYVCLYRNTGDGGFRPGGYLFGIPPAPSSTAFTFIPAAADVDLDGDLDIVGYEGNDYRPFYNPEQEVNVPPDAPGGLRGFLVGEDLFLFWSEARDVNQTTPLSYNVRVGSSPGANDLVPSHSLADGTRMLPTPGNAGFAKFFSVHLSRRDVDGVYWSVQAVDASGAGGPFAPVQSIAVDLPGNRPPEIQGPTEITMTEDGSQSLVLTLSDDRTPAGFVGLQVDSDNPQLLDSSSLTPMGVQNDASRARRQIYLNPLPNASGVATLTVVATDRNHASTTNRVLVTVTPVNDSPVISAEVSGLQFQGHVANGKLTVHDLESAPESLAVSVHSSNPELLPDANVEIRGTGAERQLVAVPVTGRTGRTVVTLTVRDPEGLPGTADITITWQNQLFTPIESGVTNLTLSQWVDFDGDGLLDVVGLDRSAGIAVYRQSVTGDLVLSTSVVSVFQTRKLLLADLDGDGDVDVVAVGSPSNLGSVTVFFNDAGLLGRSKILNLADDFTQGIVLDADADGDGDLVGVKEGVELKIWRHPPTGGDDGVVPLWESLLVSGGLANSTPISGLLAADVNGDGRMDLILSRWSNAGASAGQILIQGPDGLFSVQRPAWRVDSRVLGWTDFDRDGQPDALIEFPDTTIHLALATHSVVGLPLATSSGGLGDLNGDGFEDVLGWSSTEFRLGVLSHLGEDLHQSVFLPQLPAGVTLENVSSGDVNRDGRLDLLISEAAGSGILGNLGVVSNRPPSTPGDLHSRWVDQGIVELAWSPSTDEEQEGGLTYNVRVGTAPGLNDVVSGLALPDGRALIPGRGNAGWTNRFLLDHLPIGRTCYWSVQTVDCGFARSPFAVESSFTVTGVPVISPIADLSLRLNSEPQEVYFTVGDLETPVEELMVTVTSSNPVLLPAAGLSLSGNGTHRVLRLTPKPDRAGSAEVTLRVTDGSRLAAERVFMVFVPSSSSYAVEPRWNVEIAAGSETAVSLDSFDPDGDFRSYRILMLPQHGMLNGDAPAVRYHPQPGFTGTDTIHFLASTPGSAPAFGEVTVTVVPAYRLRPEVRFASVGSSRTLKLVVRGRAGSVVRLEHSRDLVHWDAVGEHRIPDNEVLVLDPESLDDTPPHFYRTVVLE